MAGNETFESASASSSELGFSGSYLNGQRGIRSAAVGPKLDRSRNYREGSESRMFGSGFAVSRGGRSGVVSSDDQRTLSQCIPLEPIVIGNQTTWHDEIRRVIGISVGSTAEENSFGAAAAHGMPSPPVAVVKDLKRFRLSVVDTCVKSRDRAIEMDERLHKLDKYCDFVTSKKQQRSELLINDRAGALNMKMSTQVHSINQRVEDRPKNILSNKRVRTSVAESRVECQSNSLRKQPVAMAKDGNLPEDNGGEYNLFEKIRRLAAGGEGWDKKIKRKRSVGTVFTRSIDSDGVLKRAVQNKAVHERGLQQHDAHVSSNKSHSTSLPNSTSTRLSPKVEQGAPILPRDLTAGLNKERIITKENSKFNNHDGSYTTCPSPVTKNKPLRTARMDSLVSASSSPGIPRESWENAMDEDKILSHEGDRNNKRPIAQWVGQRPQKMSRARRPNLVSPVSNQDDKQLSFESCSPSNGTNGSQKLIGKLDNDQSPLRLSKSEEYKEMVRKVDTVIVPNSGPLVTLAKKNKPLINDERWRQGRGSGSGSGSGRGPSIARSSISPLMNRLDNVATIQPLQTSKTGSKKSGSKSGRRLKRLSDRKSFTHYTPLQNSSSPDCAGGSDDDREELLAAVNHARIASHLACSSPFWKKMKPVFSCVSSEDKSFLSQQVGLPHEDSVSDALPSGEREVHMQHNENGSFSGRHDMDVTSIGFIPLYQRVLSALIIEDDIDELEEGDARITQGQNAYYTYHFNGSEPRDTIHSAKESITSNGGINSSRSCMVNGSICEDGHSEVDQMCRDDKLLLELQSIGLCLDTLPDLDDKENETIQLEIDKLKTRLHQQEAKKKVYLEKICKSVESNSGVRDLETLAMDRLVELAYRKLLGTRRSSRSGINKVPKQVALAFGKRTLDLCHKFENSGTSCFNEPPFQDILFAPSENDPEPTDSVGCPVASTKCPGSRLSAEAFAVNGHISNRGKKKELLLDDVGTAAIRATVSSETKGKRSERDTTKSGRASHNERKTQLKPKPRQETAQPPNGNGNKLTGPRHPVEPSVYRTSKLVVTQGPQDLDQVDELDIGGDLGGPQDLNSFLNFDEQDLDEDFAAGLDIPMDDLTDLF